MWPLGLVVLAVAVALLVGALVGRHLWPRPPGPEPEPPPSPPGDGPVPRVPDRLAPAALQTALAIRMAGTPFAGSVSAPDPERPSPRRVVWVDGGDEVLVHLDSLRTKIREAELFVALDLESDEHGRHTIVVPLALDGTGETAGLLVATDDLPRGHAPLAARWGAAVQEAVWSSLLALSREHASERALHPRGLSTDGSGLHFHAGARLVRVQPAPAPPSRRSS
jgi:hypothetical protein